MFRAAKSWGPWTRAAQGAAWLRAAWSCKVLEAECTQTLPGPSSHGSLVTGKVTNRRPHRAPRQTSRLPAATVCSFCELLRVRQSPRGGASAASETCQPVTHCRARELGKCGDSGPESRCREHCVSVGHSASRPFSRGIFTPRKSTDGLELYQKKHVICTLLGSAPEACELNRQKTD